MAHFLARNMAIILETAGAAALLWAFFYFFGPGRYQGIRRDIAMKMGQAEKSVNKSPFQPGTIVILPDGKVAVVKAVGNTMKGAGSGVFNFRQEITVEIPGPDGRKTAVFEPRELKIFQVPKD